MFQALSIGSSCPVFTHSKVDNQGLILERGKWFSYGNWELFVQTSWSEECVYIYLHAPMVQ
jgi:hypothetical protein